ncbi:MAG: DUF928 domain-containing protein [Cyanobacteriota bacterium]|nr:DUF928 domain-containing protein [Cyanobacteriota bacterium]
MIPFQRLAAIVASTSSILFVQLFSWIDPPRESVVRAWSSPLTPAALANSETSAKSLFALPVNSKPRRSQGSGSRGCHQGDLAEVTLLIPSEEVAGQTVSGRPSLFLYLPKSVSVPIKVTLSLPHQALPQESVLIYETQIEAPEAGIIKLELPADGPALSDDEIYMWAASLICNEKRPSANPFYNSWIERVPMTSALEEALTDVTSARDRARIYAEAGAWYDALATLYNAQMENPDDIDIQNDLNALLVDVGLTEVAQR